MKNELKEKIIDFIKIFLLLWMMAAGFWVTYCLIWFAVGLPQTNLAVSLLGVLACLTEYGYYKWLSEG